MAGKRQTKLLVERFPHLRDEINHLLECDLEFSQLSDDYELLIRTLSDQSLKAEKDREEIIALKGSLEFEVLERLTQAQWRPAEKMK